MTTFVVFDEETGAELGRASLYDGELVAEGLASEMLGGRIHGTGEPEQDAFDFFANGWSNGYVRTGRTEGEGAAKPATVPAAELRRVAAALLRDLIAGDIDDDPIGELDDDTLILLQAMAELDEEAGVEGRAWNPAQHMRWPKGHPDAGRFKPMVDLLKEAIRRHDGVGHPFDNFKREQLMKAAKARGIALKRGEDKDSIAAKLLADLAIGKAAIPPAAAAKKAVPVKKADAVRIPGVKIKKVQQIFAVAPDAYEVSYKGRVIGHVHGDEADPLFPWVPFRPAGGTWDLLDPGGKPSKKAAVKELVDSFDAHAKANPAPAAKKAVPAKKVKAAEFKLDDADRLRVKVVPFAGGPWFGKKESHQIRVGKKQIGAIHQEQDGTWTASPVTDLKPFFAAPPKKANKDEAIKALLKARDAADLGNRPDVDDLVAQDKLEELKYPDLAAVAIQHGVKVMGRPNKDIIADIRQAVAVKAKPSSAAGKVDESDLANAHMGDLVRLAHQHGIALAGKDRGKLVEELQRRMQPHDPARYHRSLDGIEDLHDIVESGAVVDEKVLAGGAIGDTRMRKYANGTRIVWKRSGAVGENDSEQLSSKVARALGLHAPRIFRNRDHEVNMDFVDGDPVADIIPGFGYMKGDTERLTSTHEGRMMGLLDQLIANTDRHNGNWMIRKDARLVPIDHGYAFGNRPGQTLRDGGKAAWVRSAFAEHYSSPVHGKLEWQDNDLTKSDIAELRKRMQALKPDFEHLGRGNWHQFMMERLDAIGQHAKGRKSRLLPPVV